MRGTTPSFSAKKNRKCKLSVFFVLQRVESVNFRKRWKTKKNRARLGRRFFVVGFPQTGSTRLIPLSPQKPEFNI